MYEVVNIIYYQNEKYTVYRYMVIIVCVKIPVCQKNVSTEPFDPHVPQGMRV